MHQELTAEQLQLQNIAIRSIRSGRNGDPVRRDSQEAFGFEGWKKCGFFDALGHWPPLLTAALNSSLYDNHPYAAKR